MRVENKIREIRNLKNITQIDAAKDLDISRQTMSAIENSKYNPSLELALKISNILINFLFIGISFYMYYSTFIAVKASIKVVKKKYDEMELKVLIDSLAISMIIVMMVYIVQTVIAINFKNYYPNGIYIPVISSGAPNGTYLGNSPLHIESIFFDIFLFSVMYNINRVRYDIIDFKKFFKPVMVSSILSAIIIMSVMLIFMTI